MNSRRSATLPGHALPALKPGIAGAAATGRSPVECPPHDVWRQDRDDGSILLGSNLALGPVARNTGEWVHEWAAKAPDRVSVGERSGAGWRELAYRELLQQVRQVAAALAGRGLGPDTPLAVLSGPSVDHAVLALAAKYVGIPLLPLAEQYSLVDAALPRLVQAIRTVRPKMVFAEKAAPFASALALDCMAGTERVCSDPHGADVPITPFAALLRGDAGAGLDERHATVSADTVAKILFTSRSEGSPKGVVTTHGMLCVNQAQIVATTMPWLRARPPRLLDWLPWSHVFGGNHNFNLMLANGGSLYIDGGKPTQAGIADTLRNVREQAGTVACNVPAGYSLLAEAMRRDSALRRAFFGDLDLMLYAAAAVTKEVWDELARRAREETGRVPLMFSAWGMSETAPSATISHQRVDRPGNIGVPLPGVTLKLIPDAAMRCELRIAGPNVMPGYFNEPEKTRAAFDAAGFMLTGDAVRFIDGADPNAGLAFDGRIAEDFKMSSGTWVRATTLRLQVLGHVSRFAADVVLTGHDRDELGLLIFPDAKALAAQGINGADDGGILDARGLRALVQHALEAMAANGAGSSIRIGRALVLATPPSMTTGELTAKGSINSRQVLTGRKALVDRLYDDADLAVIRPALPATNLSSRHA